MTQTTVRPTPSRAGKVPWATWIALALVLAVMVAVAVVGLSRVSRAIAAQESAHRAEAVTAALPEAYNAAISLASERDAALAGVPPVVMRPMQELTDEAVDAWDDASAAIDTSGEKKLRDQLAGIRTSLDGLGGLRSGLRTKGGRSAADDGYTELARSLFGLAALVPSVGDDPRSSELEALGSLQPAWEALGQERTIMLAALTESTTAEAIGTRTRSSDAQISALTEAEASWRTSIGEFYAKTSDRQQRALDQVTDSTTEDGAVGVPAQKAVNQAIDRGIAEVDLAPVEYAASSTDLVRGLHRVSVDAATEVAHDATLTRQDASTTALTIIIGVVGALAVLFVAALVLLVIGVVLSRRRV